VHVTTPRAIESGELFAMRSLLEGVGLPVDDLDDPSIALVGAFTDELVG
jgi:hypothetical protein